MQKRVREALAWLEAHGSEAGVAGLARYGITAPKAFGVSVANIQVLGKELGRDHDLAAALWDTGWYEARMLCAWVDDPALVTAVQMDRWAADFDNWGICDTLCLHLFDRTPHAWKKIAPWTRRTEEFVKRAGFALIAALGVHDKKASDEQFLSFFPILEREAVDERNFVKKGVSWALRVVGRRTPRLNAASVALASQLAASTSASARWIGKDALRDFAKVASRKK
jgi:3-methyladenine DNA glycosylase AlkD